MKFKVGDVIIIDDPLSYDPSLINTPLTIKLVNDTSYYLTEEGGWESYLFQEGSTWCVKARKVNHYKSKLGKVLYGKRY